ncbi:hypothetical protein ABZ468_25625 [Streptomyces sp. NPDC005708]|uniref:hypothetical protein n=1 Tax=Streptomyces sp. NPDC005708 TaxID=3154564 RepID=UPI0033E34FFB
MALVIVASVLGVILVTGGLFLRRLLGEITELRRQITGIDRQMRAQRAREQFLRQLTTEQHTAGTDDGPPVRAVVVNGHHAQPEHLTPDTPEPVRRKGHLGLFIGGAAAAAAASISTAVRSALRGHRNQFVATAMTAALGAASVTVVGMQPWSADTGQTPPASVPTAPPPQGYTEPPTPWPTPGRLEPQQTSPAQDAPVADPGPSPTVSAPAGDEGGSVDPSLDEGIWDSVDDEDVWDSADDEDGEGHGKGSRSSNQGHKSSAPPGRPHAPGHRDKTHPPGPPGTPPGRATKPPDDEGQNRHRGHRKGPQRLAYARRHGV